MIAYGRPVQIDRNTGWDYDCECEQHLAGWSLVEARMRESIRVHRLGMRHANRMKALERALA